MRFSIVKAEKPKQIVFYSNDINRVNLSMFSPLENNLLFSIFRKFNFVTEYKFSRDELYEMICDGSSHLSDNEIVAMLEDFVKKFLSINFVFITEKYNTYVNLFSYMKVDKESVCLSVKINSDMDGILKNIQRAFTAFDLLEFKGLKSNYSKAIFRNISQFEGTNKWIISMDEFRERFSIPKSYLIGNVKQRILEPAIKELKPYYRKIMYRILNKKTIAFYFERYGEKVVTNPQDKFFLTKAKELLIDDLVGNKDDRVKEAINVINEKLGDISLVTLDK